MKKRILLLILVSCILIVTIGAAAAPAATPDTRYSVEIGGTARTYWLHVPPGLDVATSSPLVLVLHGHGGTGEDMIAVTALTFHKVADKEKFLVVYPDGLDRQWVDDTEFLSAIAEHVGKSFAVEKKRVYATGISRGGMMAQQLACEASDRFAAIASVAGSMPDSLAPVCKPSMPSAVMLINGTDDPIIRWQGGDIVAGQDTYGRVLSVPDTAAFWSQKNGCGEKPLISRDAPKGSQDGTKIRREIYEKCSGAPVVLIAVEGGGHTWPGGYQYFGERFIGKTSRELDASQTIWEFFKQNGRKQ